MTPLKAHSRSHPYPRPVGNYHIRNLPRMNLWTDGVTRRLRVLTSGDEIVAFDLTDKEAGDASHAGQLLEQVADAPASFMGDGAYDRAHVLAAVPARNPAAGFNRSSVQGSRAGINRNGRSGPAGFTHSFDQ